MNQEQTGTNAAFSREGFCPAADNFAPLTARALFTLPTTERYAVQIVGNALTPRYQDGEQLVIDPTETARPGDAVLAVVSHVMRPGTFAPCVMLLNADGDLYDHTGGYFPCGHWELLGVVVGTQNGK